MTSTKDPGMRILLTGVSGQLGWELRRTLMPLGTLVSTCAPQESVPGATPLDLADATALRTLVRQVKPHVIVNPAAYTAVDRAEEEPEIATLVNAVGPTLLGEEARRRGAFLVHYSTDYVFSGAGNRPYHESDPTEPMSVYGRTKFDGETGVRAAGIPHLILRTAWLYGPRGHNFLRTILRLALAQKELRIVHDQTGCPTWARFVAEATAQVLAQAAVLGPDWLEERSGTYHLTAAGSASWYDFAAAILHQAALPEPPARLVPITTAEYPTRALRPAYSVLDCAAFTRTFHLRPSPWQEQLARVLEEVNSLPRLSS
jgi:dTDP-4-dehydrorhamnose reductase